MTTEQSRPSAFNVFENGDTGDASQSASSFSRENVRQRVGQDASRSVNQALVAQTHKKALEEDPSVFDYDGVYDEIQSSRQDKLSKRKAEREAEKKQSKYITSLVEKAKIREIEHERIRERRLLKERATEDALYGDKEKLISASYKRKLMEMKRWDEEDARLDAVEAAEDVTKRGTEAMAGFYSNLLTKNIAMGSDASSSRSAYTVGGKKETDTREDADASAEKREQPAWTPRHIGRDEKSQSQHHDDKETHPVAREEENEEQPLKKLKSSESEKREATTSGQTGVAKPNKEEVISAAKARYLARKAMRSTAQVTANGENATLK
ncbi:hypothetical protein PINS_up010304 [Pythium insidiosum]|nr:hypothetical protein PINS_up010304 [Pythium insidiosum]